MCLKNNLRDPEALLLRGPSDLPTSGWLAENTSDFEWTHTSHPTPPKRALVDISRPWSSCAKLRIGGSIQRSASRLVNLRLWLEAPIQLRRPTLQAGKHTCDLIDSQSRTPLPDRSCWPAACFWTSYGARMLDRRVVWCVVGLWFDPGLGKNMFRQRTPRTSLKEPPKEIVVKEAVSNNMFGHGLDPTLA